MYSRWVDKARQWSQGQPRPVQPMRSSEVPVRREYGYGEYLDDALQPAREVPELGVVHTIPVPHWCTAERAYELIVAGVLMIRCPPTDTACPHGGYWADVMVVGNDVVELKE